jgi:opacity protein-like surface antigen
MKKLLSVAVLSTLLTTSAFANQGMFSLGLTGMADLPKKERESAVNLELKSKTGATFEASVSYNVLDNVAAGLAFAYTVPTEYDKTREVAAGTPGNLGTAGPVVGTSSLSGLKYDNIHRAIVKNKVSATALYAKVCAYLYDFGYGNVFASLGAGAGSVESKYTSTITSTDLDLSAATDGAGVYKTYSLNQHKVSSKTNVSFFGKFGASFAVADDVNAMVFYSYANYGKTKDSKIAFTASSNINIASSGGGGTAGTTGVNNATTGLAVADVPQVGKFRVERNSIGFGVSVGL